MANTTLLFVPLPFLVQGDGTATSASFTLNYVPTTVILVSAKNAGGADVSSNISSVTLNVATVTINFVNPFTGLITVVLNFNAPLVGGGGSPSATVVQVNNFPATQAVTGTLAVTQSTSPWVVSLSSTTITGSVAVTQSTSPWVVGGTVSANATGILTNNNATPIANNLGVLAAVANAASPTLTEGNQALLSEDLSGNLRVNVNVPLPAGTNQIGHVITDSGSTTAVTGTVGVTQSTSPWLVNLTQVAGVVLGSGGVTSFGTAPSASAVPGVNASLFAGITGITATGSSLNVDVTNTVPVTLTSTTITGTVAVTQSTSPWVVSLASTTVTNTVAENLTQVNSVALGSPSAYGTSPGAVNVAGVNAFITNTPAVTISSGTVTTVSTVTAVTAITNALPAGTNTIGKIDILGNAGATLDQANGSAVPTNGLMVGGGSIAGGTNFTALTVKAASVAAAATDTSLVVQPLVGSHTMNTAAAGTQLVGIVGNTAATLDSSIGAATAPTNAIATLGVYQSTVPALTTGQSVAAQCDTTGSYYVNEEGRKATYSASSVFTPVAGDIAVLPGSATKTIRVLRVEVSLSTSGSAAYDTVQLIKRSTADTLGTSAAMTKVPHDSNFAAASAAPLQYTAAPTPGTAVGAVRGAQIYNPGGGSALSPNIAVWTFGTEPGGSTIVLRGTAQQLCVNLSAVVATQTVSITFVWTEE